MKRKLFTGGIAVMLCLAMSGNAQQKATSYTEKENMAVKTRLNFNNRADFEDAHRGFIATLEDEAIENENGSVSYPLNAWKFLEGEAPATANPSLWRQSQLNAIHGLFEVVPGAIYQVRGFDLANMTFVRTDHGWIIIDATTSEASALAGYRLVKQHLGDLPVRALIITHPHIDHYGGMEAICREVSNKDMKIIVPKGFYEEALSENVMAGTAMGRRASYMYGLLLPRHAGGNIGTGLGTTNSRGKSMLVRPTDEIETTGERRVIDGLEMEFMFVPEAEAPVEMMIWFPKYKAFCAAEEITHTMHNLLTLRGAKVRNGLLWSKYIDDVIARYGNDVEVTFSLHHWPTWGNEKINTYWAAQRDMYRYLHDQTLRMANQGLTPNEIAEQLVLPIGLDSLFACRGYYGSLSHNVKSQYQMYFGWFDGNPANLNPLPPVELGRKYVEAIGGGERVIEVARKAYDEGEYRWCATLLNNLVFAEPENQTARQLLADVYTQLGYQAESGPWRNFYLTGAKELRGEINRQVPNLVNASSVSNLGADMLLDFCAIQVNGMKAGDKRICINLTFKDCGEKAMLLLNNGALNHRMGYTDAGALLSLQVTRNDFARLILKEVRPEELIDTGKMKITGDLNELKVLLSLLDSFDPMFNIIEP